MPDICVATHTKWDIMCLDILLYSLSRFADLPSMNVFVSNNSDGMDEMLENTCLKYDMMSLHLDCFKTTVPAGNLQHAEMLNRLISSTTSKHVVLLDPDVIITSSCWRTWCESRMDNRFLIGTPYVHPERAWVGDIPNSWCTFVDGDTLRGANLDMRPQVRYRARKKRWVLSGRRVRDCSWRLGWYLRRRKLNYISLPLTESKNVCTWIEKRLRRLRGDKNQRYVRKFLGRQVLDDLKATRPTGYRLPDSGNIGKACCLHLKSNHRIRPRTLKRWIACGKRIVDVCYEVGRL